MKVFVGQSASAHCQLRLRHTSVNRTAETRRVDQTDGVATVAVNHRAAAPTAHLTCRRLHGHFQTHGGHVQALEPHGAIAAAAVTVMVGARARASRRLGHRRGLQ